MNTHAPAPIDAAVASEIASLLRSGADHEDAIRLMREHGLQKIDCIKLLRDHSGIPLGKAKDIVHSSRSWSDRFESDERLHDELEEAWSSIDQDDTRQKTRATA